ncbi:MAG: helix-turn-helix domain-containing protein [Myxococcota bacterium]
MNESRYQALLRGETAFSAEDPESWGEYALPALALGSVMDRCGRPVLAHRPTDVPTALAHNHLSRFAFISGETPPAEPRLAREPSGLPGLILQMAIAWRMLALGHRTPLSSEDRTRIRQSRCAELVVDLSLYEASVQLFHGGEDSLSIARSAAQKARSEGFVDRELFAALLLSRARRFAGQAFLSRWLLQKLNAAFPASWNRWVHFERVMVGERPSQPYSGHAQAALALYDAVQGATATRTTGDWDRFRPELDALAVLLGRSRDETAPSVPPFGIRDLYVRQPKWDLVFDPDSSCRICLPSARPASHDAVALTDCGPRPAKGLAVLATRQGRMGVRDWFKEVFGYRMAGNTHANLFRVTLHRMRQSLPEGARVEREEDVLTLVCKRPLVLPDPDAQDSLEERVLEQLTVGLLSTRDLAAKLNAPVRSIQAALKALVDSGVCEALKRGKGTVYRVEDTSFFEPTLTRLSRFSGAG